MSYITDLIEEVNSTHSNLGKLVVISLLSVKAKKVLLIVSPSGCGKSTAMSLISKNVEGAIMPDRLSIAGLCVLADKLTGFRSVVIVDDFATSQTDYARRTTVTTLVALVYTHRIQSIMQGIEYSIEDFYGSALIGIQPILLKNLMLAEEWDASIQDKALRYYHLYRPLIPNLTLPKVEIRKGLPEQMINDFEPDAKNPNWKKLCELADSQWSKARGKEHLKDYLKAIASLEMRKDVIEEDYKLLTDLLKPMSIENVVVIKEQLEGERYLNNDLLALLAEYYTYGGEFALAHVSIDYKLSVSQTYRIMRKQNGFWNQIHKTPTIYKPSEALLKMLQTYDLDIKEYTKRMV